MTLLAPRLPGAIDVAPPAEAPTEDTLPQRQLALLDEKIPVHYPEGHPDAPPTPQSQSESTPQESFRSTPLHILAIRAFLAEEAKVASLNKEEAQLKNRLFDEQKPLRENPERVHGLMTGTSAERVDEQIPFRLTRKAIDEVQKARRIAHTRGAVALAYALERARKEKLDL